MVSTASAGTGCTGMSNNNTSESSVSSTSRNMGTWSELNNEFSGNILSSADSILTQQNNLLQQQNEQLDNKRLRNEIQLNAIDAKKNIINTRARMLQIAQENNVYKQKIIYTLIAFIFAVFIAILVMYVFYNKKK